MYLLHEIVLICLSCCWNGGSLCNTHDLVEIPTKLAGCCLLSLEMMIHIIFKNCFKNKFVYALANIQNDIGEHNLS